MEKYIPILRKCRLFAGVGEDEIGSMLSCLNAKARSYKSGEYVFRQGAHPGGVVVLAEGRLHIQNDDYWGNRSILSEIAAGEIFGEAYAAPDSGALLNDVLAVEDSAIILFDIKSMLTTCSSACPFHARVVQNLFYLLAEKNRKLVGKLGHMSKRSTREKLISYLSEEAKRQQSASFDIPFNRQQLADYLSVDRSAMSAELSKMRNEGLLEFRKNSFRLLHKD